MTNDRTQIGDALIVLNFLTESRLTMFQVQHATTTAGMRPPLMPSAHLSSMQPSHAMPVHMQRRPPESGYLQQGPPTNQSRASPIDDISGASALVRKGTSVSSERSRADHRTSIANSLGRMRHKVHNRKMRLLGIDPHSHRLQNDVGPTQTEVEEEVVLTQRSEVTHRSGPILTHRSELWDGKSEISEVDFKSEGVYSVIAQPSPQNKGRMGDAMLMEKIDEEPLVTSSFELTSFEDLYGSSDVSPELPAMNRASVASLPFSASDVSPPFGMNHGVSISSTSSNAPGLSRSNSVLIDAPEPGSSSVALSPSIEQVAPQVVDASVDVQASQLGLLPLEQLTHLELHQEQWLLENWGLPHWRSALVDAIVENEIGCRDRATGPQANGFAQRLGGSSLQLSPC